MSSKDSGILKKKSKKSQKRKKDLNASGDENRNKSHRLSSSHETLTEGSIYADIVRDLNPFFSTPLTSRLTPGTIDDMSYNLSPVSFQPQGPPTVQHVGSFHGIEYGSKIDSLAITLEKMCQKLNKLDGIESKLTNFEQKIEKVTEEVSTLKSTVNEIEKSVKFASDSLDANEKRSQEMTNTLTEITKNSRKIEIENSQLKKDLSKIRSQMKELNDQQLDLQTRSMRDNLIFHGIEENDGENCESVLKEFIADVLKVEQSVEFHRVHRMGRKIHGKTRPIVAKFVQFKEREIVRKSVYTALAGKEENKKYGINEHVSPYH